MPPNLNSYYEALTFNVTVFGYTLYHKEVSQVKGGHKNVALIL